MNAFQRTALLLLVLGMSGCAQRAYNELYVENMASEIRLLEDRIYEYDAEYRALENELIDLQTVNEGLEAKLRAAEQEQTNARFQPKAKSSSDKPLEPKRAEPKPAEPKPAEPKPKESTPVTPKESLKLPPSDPLQLEVETPEPPALKPPAKPDSGDLPAPKVDSKPAIPIPDKPILPEGASSAPRGLPSSVKSASFEERRIDAPTLARHESPNHETKKNIEVVQDNRVRQIDFHPGLCRGLNKDGKPGEEGIALVLVPRNIKQEFILARGNVTIVMEEASDSGTRRLGRWDYRPEEVAELLEPVGSSQGIHLQLLWQEAVPESQTVDVYVRFTDEQGIAMVNHRQIHLRKSSQGQSTWTPR